MSVGILPMPSLFQSSSASSSLQVEAADLESPPLDSLRGEKKSSSSFSVARPVNADRSTSELRLLCFSEPTRAAMTWPWTVEAAMVWTQQMSTASRQRSSWRLSPPATIQAAERRMLLPSDMRALSITVSGARSISMGCAKDSARWYSTSWNSTSSLFQELLNLALDLLMSRLWPPGIVIVLPAWSESHRVASSAHAFLSSSSLASSSAVGTSTWSAVAVSAAASFSSASSSGWSSAMISA
mmetsp:Transcript_26437/g.78825  ORF Transcript_26437/g.78825 Transcript_26437/m.78825 type:complete len:241 (-) Transcript_26437:439-1161(-)